MHRKIYQILVSGHTGQNWNLVKIGRFQGPTQERWLRRPNANRKWPSRESKYQHIFKYRSEEIELTPTVHTYTCTVDLWRSKYQIPPSPAYLYLYFLFLCFYRHHRWRPSPAALPSVRTHHLPPPPSATFSGDLLLRRRGFSASMELLRRLFAGSPASPPPLLLPWCPRWTGKVCLKKQKILHL